jgi:hypothetical protein
MGKILLNGTAEATSVVSPYAFRVEANGLGDDDEFLGMPVALV